MSTEPLLSLVMPVYNVAEFLPRCLDSLLAQTRPADEVIAVDDGSTDDCPAILADYAARWPALRVLRQDNAGLSAARNAGLARARGRYLAFVDSDDTVAPEAYARWLAAAQALDLDMLVGNGSYHFEGRRDDYPIHADALPQGRLLAGAELLRRRLAAGTLLHMVWLHLYRRAFVEELGLRFPPGRIHEDVVWTTRALLAAGRVAYDAAPVYRYRQRVRRFAPADKDRRLAAIIESSIANAEELAELAAAAPDEELRRLIGWQLVDGGLAMFHKVRQFSSARLRRQWLRRLRQRRVFALLWRHAGEARQRRRIARNFLLSCAPV